MERRIRKNEADLSRAEWRALIDAIDALQQQGAARPRYRTFVRVHVAAMTSAEGMAWGVHTMHGMPGRNFLAWHRLYLDGFERRLRKIDGSVTLPYWDWIANPRIPRQINRAEQLDRWEVSRAWDAEFLPSAAELDAVMSRRRFSVFQQRLEMLHGSVHIAVGGTMSGASSPADPIFWMHHANIDRLWARWQAAHPRQLPDNLDETLEPEPILDLTIEEVLKPKALGYSYD